MCFEICSLEELQKSYVVLYWSEWYVPQLCTSSLSEMSNLIAFKTAGSD